MNPETLLMTGRRNVPAYKGEMILKMSDSLLRCEKLLIL